MDTGRIEKKPTGLYELNQPRCQPSLQPFCGRCGDATQTRTIGSNRNHDRELAWLRISPIFSLSYVFTILVVLPWAKCQILEFRILSTQAEERQTPTIFERLPRTKETSTPHFLTVLLAATTNFTKSLYASPNSSASSFLVSLLFLLVGSLATITTLVGLFVALASPSSARDLT